MAASEDLRLQLYLRQDADGVECARSSPGRLGELLKERLIRNLRHLADEVDHRVRRVAYPPGVPIVAIAQLFV